MKKLTSITFVTALLVTGAAAAADSNEPRTEPVSLTAEQMDSVTAAGYGKTIIDVVGVSFGQLVGPAKSSGTAAHGNYAGGAKALVETVCVHLPSAPGC